MIALSFRCSESEINENGLKGFTLLDIWFSTILWLSFGVVAFRSLGRMADLAETDVTTEVQKDTKDDEQPSTGSGSASGSVTASPAHSSGSASQAGPGPGQSKAKIDVLLKATGDAPIMKKKKWAVDPTKKVCWIVEFIKKYIKCEAPDSVFLYVNQSFCPSPDTEIGAVYDCFGSDGKLILHYCRTQAWG